MPACRTCGAAVRPEEVVEGLAQCSACGTVGEVNVPAALTAPPPGVDVQVYPEGVALRLPWRRDHGGLMFVVLTVLGLGMIGLFIAGESTVLTLIAGLALTYFNACTLLNTTEVLVGPGGVEVRHGPLPGRYGACQVTASVIREGLHSTVHDQPTRGGRVVRTYGLDTGGPSPTVLLHRWREEATVAYVREVVEVIVGLR